MPSLRPTPYLMAPVRYIDSDALARDDLLSHGGYVVQHVCGERSSQPVPDNHHQGDHDDTAADHCAQDHDKRVRIAPSVDGTPHACYDTRAGDDGTATRNGRTAPDHVRARNDGFACDDGPTPGYDRTGHDSTTRHYRGADNHAPHKRHKVTVTTSPPLPPTTAAPVTTALPVTTTSEVSTPTPTAALPAATTVPNTTSVPPTTTLAGLRVARADKARAGQ